MSNATADNLIAMLIRKVQDPLHRTNRHESPVAWELPVEVGAPAGRRRAEIDRLTVDAGQDEAVGAVGVEEGRLDPVPGRPEAAVMWAPETGPL